MRNILIPLALLVFLNISGLNAQYSTRQDLEIREEMKTFITLLTSEQNYLVVNNEKRPLPKDITSKRKYWQKELKRGKKGDKPSVEDSTSMVIPIAEALQIADKSLEFTHWSPVYNLGKVWGGRVEFKRNETRYEANYFWYNNKLLDLLVRPYRENSPNLILEKY
ncbi:MAG TPA: hypothetical protein DHU63_11060 [Candidatus Marinimicrobia bacterium]|nr:MAG: hypothetical protein AUJ47_07715 [Candidatus Marinimicrobia bacterium CG1_02_48_14]PIZ70500.1 MAG: hypothetical protein COY19_00025 [Candidatus Marinimicrobia bacterium CG_4_10_14_0_2_um_filter_48_9]PJA55049.1 MAG: hypothetical protein CO167_00375 [Candidatus Marinimicrobia bacterium CG_4_9_14_3_um_filter_48_9]HCW77060.1 hypothetical protein [Candidatus Neomarinimicrobiota bacterium]